MGEREDNILEHPTASAQVAHKVRNWWQDTLAARMLAITNDAWRIKWLDLLPSNVTLRFLKTLKAYDNDGQATTVAFYTMAVAYVVPVAKELVTNLIEDVVNQEPDNYSG